MVMVVDVDAAADVDAFVAERCPDSPVIRSAVATPTAIAQSPYWAHTLALPDFMSAP
ncbi:hypothetical protein [Streptomyces sp. NPDC048603]|uniref:hypothetical protein n=1 Tax=Streptomyces sp. NPDC048603 TaxID=3365577 RepID=UPI00371B8F39